MFSAVRSNRTAYRFRSLHFLVIRFRALVSEGSKQSVHSFSSTSLRFIRSHTVCIELASSHGGLCLSSQASNESTVSCIRYGTASRTLRFLHLAVPSSNQDSWTKKFEPNKKRDLENLKYYQEQCWRVCLVWECSIRGKNVIQKIESVKAKIIQWLEESSDPFLEIKG